MKFWRFSSILTTTPTPFGYITPVETKADVLRKRPRHMALGNSAMISRISACVSLIASSSSMAAPASPSYQGKAKGARKDQCTPKNCLMHAVTAQRSRTQTDQKDAAQAEHSNQMAASDPRAVDCDEAPAPGG